MKRGDRVLLNHDKLRELEEIEPHQSGWSHFTTGTITQARQNEKYAYGSELPDKTDRSWGVRWDEYGDYGTPTNCHSCDEILLLPDVLDEDELTAALASIEQAARNTMSTQGGSHERAR